MINLPASLTGRAAPTPAPSSGGSIRLPSSLTGAPASAPTAPAPARSSTTPGATPQVQPLTSDLRLPLPGGKPEAPIAPAYGGSQITDQSGKPLLTYTNPKAEESQLLSDRVYPGFDPTKPQKLDASILQNGRMPLSVSEPLKKQMGGAYSDELDHKIALELSGSNNPSNLQIEPGIKGGISAAHDQLENSLKDKVISGKLALADAQEILATAKGYRLPEFGGSATKAGNPNSNYADAAHAGIQGSGPLTEGKPIQTTNTAPRNGVLGAYPATLQTLSDLQLDPASLKSDPRKAILDYWNGVKDSAANLGSSLASWNQARKQNDVAGAVGGALKTAAAGANWAISPITSLFSAANDIPILGTLSKLITLPFQFMGDAGHDTAKVLVNSIPDKIVSPEAKNKVVDGVGDILALAGQFALGSISEKATSGLAEKYGPEDAATIVSKAKEIAQSEPTTETPKETTAPTFTEKPLPEPEAPASTAERAGFVNPEAFTDSAKEALAKYKEGQESAKYGEALRTSFTGERDSRVAETNQLRDQLAKGLSSKEQEALTLMRDFKNKPGELEAFANGTHDYYDKLPPAERAAAVERVQTLKPIVDLALNPTENMKVADAAMTDYFSKHLAEGQKLGFLASKISNDEYISHLLQPKGDAGRVVAKDGGLRTYKIGRRTPFATERTYPTVLHAIANGVEPRTLNALDALTIYGDKHATAAATHILIQNLKDSGVAKWGSHGAENIPSDWKPLAPESRLFQNQIPFTDKEGKPGIAHQSLFAPEKVVEALRPLTDPDYTSRIPGFTKSRLYQAYLKSVELGLSVFHLRALNLTAIGNEGVTGLIKSYATDMESPAFLDTERAFIKAGGTSPILGRTVEAYRELQPSSIPSRLDILRSAPGFKQFDQVAAKLSKLTFDIVQRKMKVTDFALKDAKWIADNPDATPADHYTAQRALAKEVNAAYGGLNWEALGVNKMTHSLVKALLLAPDWTFSNWINAKEAFKGGPAGNAARAFFIRSAITGVVASELTSVLLSGKRSTDPTSVYLGKDKNGKDIYQNLFFAGAPGDVVNLMKNVQDYGAIAGLGQTLLGKLAPILKTGEETVTNKNYLGQDVVPKGSGVIAGTGRSAVNIAESLGPVPFSLTNIVQMLIDPQKQYTEKEFITTLLSGTRPRHVIPPGMRQITSGKKKGQLAPQPARQKNSLGGIIGGGPVYKPKPK